MGLSSQKNGSFLTSNFWFQNLPKHHTCIDLMPLARVLTKGIVLQDGFAIWDLLPECWFAWPHEGTENGTWKSEQHREFEQIPIKVEWLQEVNHVGLPRFVCGVEKIFFKCDNVVMLRDLRNCSSGCRRPCLFHLWLMTVPGRFRRNSQWWMVAAGNLLNCSRTRTSNAGSFLAVHEQDRKAMLGVRFAGDF